MENKVYKYRTIFEKIVKVEVVKETAKQIVYLSEKGYEIREAKKTSYTSIHDTFDEAKAYLLKYLEEELKVKKKSVSNTVDKINVVKNLKE